MDISVEHNLPKASDARLYFEKLIEETKGHRIKSVYIRGFSLSFFSDNVREYSVDDNIYINFDNEMSLVVNFVDMDGLSLQYRSMDPDEKKSYDNAEYKDIFNNSIDIYQSESVVENNTITFEYGELSSVELRKRTKSYDKWHNHNICEFEPSNETFDMITFYLSNGNTFIIEPDLAIFDGYQSIYSDDAVELLNGHPYTSDYEYGKIKEE
ncbi:MAG: hypothetical protein MJ171_00395 [Clostridia bacterium]|nr:hypothetical protein [Clostridia bacterium]